MCEAFKKGSDSVDLDHLQVGDPELWCCLIQEGGQDCIQGVAVQDSTCAPELVRLHSNTRLVI